MPYNHISIKLISFVLFFTACNNDDPVLENEEELITTVILYMTPQGSGTTRTQIFRDIDGPGGDPPVFSTQDLTSPTTYDVEIELLNETVSPSDNISDDVREEAEVHQFFFEADNLDLTFTYADEDVDGNPLGLESTCVTGAAGAGTLTVILRHLPDKFAPGVSDGDITNAGGETDVQVVFTLSIE